jgi:hypothetical protein
VEAPAGCKFDFLTDSSECPSSLFRETRTSDVAHAADHDKPKIERENFEDDTLGANEVRYLRVLSFNNKEKRTCDL